MLEVWALAIWGAAGGCSLCFWWLAMGHTPRAIPLWGTGAPRGPEGSRVWSYLPAQADLTQAGPDVMESWPAAAGSHRSWLYKAGICALTTTWNPDPPPGHQGPGRAFWGLIAPSSASSFHPFVLSPRPLPLPPVPAPMGWMSWGGVSGLLLIISKCHLRADRSE